MYVPVISVGENLPLRTYRPAVGGDFGYAVEYVHTSTQEQVAVRYSVTVTGDRHQDARMNASVGLLDLRAPITGWVELVNPSTIVQQLAPVFLETRSSLLFAYGAAKYAPQDETPYPLQDKNFRGVMVYHPAADVTETDRVAYLHTVIYELNKYARNIINGEPLD